MRPPQYPGQALVHTQQMCSGKKPGLPVSAVECILKLIVVSSSILRGV